MRGLGKLGLGLNAPSSGWAEYPTLNLPAVTYELTGTVTNDWKASAGITGWVAGQGTVLLEFTDTTPQPAANRMLLWIGSATVATDAIYLQHRSTGTAWRHAVYSNTVRQAELDPTHVQFHAGKHKVAISWEAGKVRFVHNGIQRCYDASLSLPADLAGIGVGCLGSGETQGFEGTIQYFGYSPTVFTEAEMVQWTRDVDVKASGVTNDPDLNVVICMGQSNSSGPPSATIGSPVYVNPIKMIKNDGTLADYDDPYDVSTSAIFSKLSDASAAMSYAGYVIDRLATAEGGTWAALPANKASTTIAADWGLNVAGPIGYDEVALDVGWSAAMQSKLANQHGVLRGMIWHFGESDAIAGTSKAVYKAFLVNYLARWRASIGEYAPVVISTLHAYHTDIGGTEASWNAINEALIEVAAEEYRCALADIRHIPGNSSDDVHLDDTAQLAAAPIYAAALNTLL
jgi:hypothetical protein